jgi:hypothetical protein
MPTSDINQSEQLRAERHAVETLYRAFSDQNPDLVDQAVVPDWKDIPLARHTGPFVGIPASGADITMRSIDIWRFDNDRFVEHWDELNLLEVFQQMGAIPMQPGATR